MDDFAFAFGITFPGTTSTDIVTAAIKHSVHIVDKEQFDPAKQYQQISDRLHPHADTTIYPLYIFPKASILVNDEPSLRQALALSQQYQF